MAGVVHTSTAEQIERGLTDCDEVRLEWVKRMDYVPTPEQIERGLSDPVSKVRKAWQERVEFEHVRKLKEAREAEAENLGAETMTKKLTAKQVERYLKH
ncbi:hypothetical protein GN074_08530, partial [Helicobacter pylori]|nr:hypothetical protein [Helicobacter pylori]MWR36384.1 hypothetical protein [Helicobacter pylori]